jgi:predicted Zn finger-like uncharacterized protein
MRLICPNCGAQYEVPDDVIPQEGRDVQCSACSNTWFQAHASKDAALADEMDAPSMEEVAAPPPAPAPEEAPAHPAPVSSDRPPPSGPTPRSEPKQRGLDPEIADVLREEAEREAAARAAEKPVDKSGDKSALESQPDLGLTPPEPEDEATRRAREARERMARMRGEPLPAEVAVAQTVAASGSRRDLLPDIDEINSTLRASGERRRPAEATDADIGGTDPKLRSEGHSFRRGFFTVLVFAALAIGSYIYGPQLAESIPAIAPYVSDYITQVDTARSWLSVSIDQGLAWLDRLATENL